MKTFPDFTWEWITESCEAICKHLQEYNHSEPDRWHIRQRATLQSAQGTIAIVPKLREHPHLGNLVPMKSLLSLRWFPAKDIEVQLYCDENQEYRITVLGSGQDIVEEKVVAFNEVADEVYACIDKFRDV